MTPPRQRAPLQAGLVLLLLLVATAAWALPVWTTLGTRAIGVLGDPDEYTWFLGWFRYAASAHVNPLLSDYMNYPAGINLMWNTSNPLVALLASPLTGLVGPIAAYNLLVPMAMAVSGWCAYLAARHFGASVPASAFAGLLFTFSPYMLAQGRAHLSTLVVAFVPLLAIALDEVLVRQRYPAWRLGLAIGVLMGLQLLVLEEYVATAALFALIVLAAVLLVARRWNAARAAYVLRALAIAVVAFAVLGAWPLYIQFLGPHRPALGTTFHEEGRFVIDLANLALPTPVQAFVPPGATAALGSITGDLYENSGYIGLPLLVAICVLVIARWRDRTVRVMALVGAACVIVSFGSHLHIRGGATPLPLPGALWVKLPLLNNALPARFSLYTTVVVVVLAALFVDRWVLQGSGRRRLLAIALTALVVLTWLPSLPWSFAQPVPRFFATSAVDVLPQGDVVVLAPWPLESVEQGMVWQSVAQMRFRLVGGYFLYADPHGTEFVGSPVTSLETVMNSIEDGSHGGELGAGEAARLLADLRNAGADAVIVADVTPHRDRMVAMFTQLLGRAPERIADVSIWRGLNA